MDILNNMNTDRANYMVQQLEGRLSTMESLAEKYNISRQRVSEIFYKTSGRPKGWLKFQKKIERDTKKEIKLNETNYICANCGRNVTHKNTKHKSKYCDMCHTKNGDRQKNLNITLRCEVCRRKYHPYRTKRTQHNYCGRTCFHRSRIVGPLWLNKKYAEKMGIKRGE